ncbi:MAG: putative aminohydrolase SsnA [Anaerolineaceae bacterium]|nr:putative aminohydrolase SsnA [Anaerolineaceae bacterium]
MKLITNGRLVTWDNPNRIIEDHAILIDGKTIKEIDNQDRLVIKYADAERIDAKGSFVFPGNICAHTHFYGAFVRGMSIPGTPARNFPEILSKLWFPLDKSLKREDIRYSALVCLINAIRHGTTTLIDHHASSTMIAGSLDEIANAVDETGLRAALCYEVTDRNGEENTNDAIKENQRFIEYVKKEKPADGRLSAHFGLHASLTLSEQTLERCRKAVSDDVGFHIHVGEDSADQYDSIQKCGLRVVDRLFKHGLLGERSIAVHAVHVDQKELELLKETKTWVTHQPRSNMNNAVGVASVESMLRAGIRVCMGNDGFSNAMWEEWKTGYFLHKLNQRDPRVMPATTIVQMAVYNNAALASQVFDETIGVIKPGALADLIFVEYHPITPINEGNLPWHIIMGFNESMINSTMVNGQMIMENRELKTVDEEKIAYYAEKILVPEVWKRFQAQYKEKRR